MWLSAAVEIRCKWLVDDDGQVSDIINPPLIINNLHNPRIIQSNPIQSLSYRVRQTLVIRRCFFGSHQIDCVNIPDVYENVFMTMALGSVKSAISAAIDVPLLTASSETVKIAHTEILTPAHKRNGYSLANEPIPTRSPSN